MSDPDGSPDPSPRTTSRRIGHPGAVTERESPVSNAWRRAKDRAPRQKQLAATLATVRRRKPGSPDAAREALVAEAARRGITDLSDKELATMTDAVTTSAKDAAAQAVSKGTAGIRSMWATLQTAKPAWTDLPDNVAALNLRSDQRPVDVTVTTEVPDVVDRLTAELPADEDGARGFNVWLGLDPATDAAAVCVGRERLGRVPDENVPAIRDELRRRSFWVRARLVDDTVRITLPDHA